MRVKFFNPGKEYKQLKKELLPKIDDVLSRGDLILRKDVEIFENKLAKYIGVKYACGVNSCTDALYLSLKYLGIGKGDQVLVPSRTFVASVQVIVQLGAEPVYYDLNGNSEGWKNIKAIIPVHIEGEIDSNMDTILNTLKRFKVPVIEDSAQALGATYKGKMAGSIGLSGCFSFYPAKILGACGDAGALVTNDKKLYEWAKEARNHFKNTNKDWGINSRLDNLQACILNVKFKYHKRNLARRKKIAMMYDKGLRDLKITLPEPSKDRVWQDYIIRLDSKRQRDRLFDYLKEKGIETMKNNYPFPVKKLPLAQAYEDETLRLPCNPMLNDSEINYIIKKVKEAKNALEIRV